MFELLNFIKFADVVDVLCVTALVYGLLFVMARGRSVTAVRGMMGVVLVLVLAFGLAKLLHLTTVAMLFSYFWMSLVLVLAVVFQVEIRKLMLQIGESWFMKKLLTRHTTDSVDTLCDSIMEMSKKKVGALICLQGSDSLSDFIRTGITINATISDELLRTIFTPPSPLHDGAVVVSDDKIVAAGCLLPLTDRTDLSNEIGTRHRAGIGASEDKDTVVVVVSEETGRVSLCKAGNMYMGFNSAPDLRSEINRLLKISEEEEEELKVQAKTVAIRSINLDD